MKNKYTRGLQIVGGLLVTATLVMAAFGEFDGHWIADTPNMKVDIGQWQELDGTYTRWETTTDPNTGRTYQYMDHKVDTDMAKEEYDYYQDPKNGYVNEA